MRVQLIRTTRGRGLPAIAVAVATALACTRGPAPAQTADTIYTSGDIVTVNDDQPTAEALAVKDGKILAVGAKADVEKAHKGTTTQVVDLGGKTLLPSFLDAHSHYINSLLVANQCTLYAPPSGPGRDVQSIFAELKKFAGRARFRPVKTGITGVTDIEITGGLQEGDEIVTGSYKVLRELKHLTRVRKAKDEENRPPS